MNLTELNRKQDELNVEKIACPRCKEITTWGELRNFGYCLECYYQWRQKETEVETLAEEAQRIKDETAREDNN